MKNNMHAMPTNLPVEVGDKAFLQIIDGEIDKNTPEGKAQMLLFVVNSLSTQLKMARIADEMGSSSEINPFIESVIDLFQTTDELSVFLDNIQWFGERYLQEV